MRKAIASLLPVLVVCAAGACSDRRYDTNENLFPRGRTDTARPGDQGENPQDLKITQDIRRAILQDDSLPTNARNVKVITANGVVTLRGPVNDDQERRTIARKAEQMAGVMRVDNQLDVMPIR